MADTIFTILLVGSSIGIVGWCIFIMDCVGEIKRNFKL